MNSIQCMEVYRKAGCWCFTDERLELYDEPFIAGATQILDTVIMGQGVYSTYYRIVFSDTPFPAKNLVHLVRMEPQYEGYNYSYMDDKGEQSIGWLCPATTLFFPEEGHPTNLYFSVEAL